MSITCESFQVTACPVPVRRSGRARHGRDPRSPRGVLRTNPLCAASMSALRDRADANDGVLQPQQFGVGLDQLVWIRACGGHRRALSLPPNADQASRIDQGALPIGRDEARQGPPGGVRVWSNAAARRRMLSHDEAAEPIFGKRDQ